MHYCTALHQHTLSVVHCWPTYQHFPLNSAVQCAQCTTMHNVLLHCTIAHFPQNIALNQHALNNIVLLGGFQQITQYIPYQ